jgi:Cdc6-like AAA superfamily ATPase
MSPVTSAVQSSSLTQKIVLLALADASMADDTPVASVDIRPRCQTLLDEAATDVVSRPDESDIMRALSTLGTEPYVDELTSETTPTGKGRPRYDLDTDISEVLDALEDDERLETTVQYVQNS